MEGTIYALRGILLILAVIISFVKIRISPSTEIVPTLNSCAGLMGFFFFKVWTWIVERFGAAPWASQGKEMQCFRPAFSLPTKPHLAIRGFGSYHFDLSERVVGRSGDPGTQEFMNPSLLWMAGFLLLICFPGILLMIQLTKIMIVDLGLSFPSATAMGPVINSLNTPQGAELQHWAGLEMEKLNSGLQLWDNYFSRLQENYLVSLK
ncbi:hypothetical protein CDL15_Pgr011247 [Punica granatum]|uniref:Uncharacterized protein n=1 Tax=Punica granatum TaxID=22663 RepID=A0A218WFJ2_PUNGR|nr:hypothetical protein CDL15_Pgr011247 [Punica granatum]